MIKRQKLDEKLLGSFYFDFLEALKKEVALGIDATNRFLLQFQSRVIQGADAKIAIKERHESIRKAYLHYIKSKEILANQEAEKQTLSFINWRV